MKDNVYRGSNKSSWTEERDQILRNMWPIHSVKEIAYFLKVSRPTVTKRRNVLNLSDKVSQNNWPTYKINEFKSMWDNASEYTVEDIAKHFNRHKSRIDQLRKKLNLPKRCNPRLWNDEQVAQFKRMWIEGINIKHICFELNKSTHDVEDKRQELDLLTRVIKSNQKKYKIKCLLNEEEMDKFKKLAVTKHRTVSKYLAILVRREIGFNR